MKEDNRRREAGRKKILLLLRIPRVSALPVVEYITGFQQTFVD